MAQSKADVFTEITLSIGRVNGLMQGRGDRTAGRVGLSAARWIVLGTLVRGGAPMTVPEIARTLGQTRQSIQRLVNAMIDDGLLELQDNPGHAISKKVILTEQGRKIHTSLRTKQEKWSERCADDMALTELKVVAGFLSELIKKLEA